MTQYFLAVSILFYYIFYILRLSSLQDRRYADLTEDQLPSCESLKDTIARALPYWNKEIAPQIKQGKRVLIAAHGNSLRGIVKHLEGGWCYRVYMQSFDQFFEYLSPLTLLVMLLCFGKCFSVFIAFHNFPLSQCLGFFCLITGLIIVFFLKTKYEI